MLVHLRVVTPPDLSAAVRSLLCDHDDTTNVVVLPGVAVDPVGDVIECDAARESISTILHGLHRLGLPAVGGIVVSTPTATPFAAAARLEARAPGDPDDAVIWDAVLGAAEQCSRPTLTYLIFLLLATMLAAVAVITDSSVLVVGAMVVGPEFSAVSAACTGLAFRRWSLLRDSLTLLVSGFVFAILVTLLVALVGVAAGLLSADQVTAPRPLTGFIWHPDRWSVVVALLAGAAGVLALTTSRSDVMVGVFISVTTVPAAGNLALGLAVRDRAEILGSGAQLVVNIGCMLLAGTLTMIGQRYAWDRLSRHSAEFFALLGRKQQS